MNIPKNLFELSDLQIDESKMMYNNKVIKCLVAPYHSYQQLEHEINYTPSTYLFPERELSYSQTRKFVSMLTNSMSTDEIIVITSSMNIIGDMVSGCVRILDQQGVIQESDVRTFAANIHDIKLKVLENPDFEMSKAEQSNSTKKINDVIEKINSGNISDDELEGVSCVIESIGEPIIRTKLREMLQSVKPTNKTPYYLNSLKTGKVSIAMAREILNYAESLDSYKEQNQLLDGLKSVNIV
jgi:hypothetical protein